MLCLYFFSLVIIVACSEKEVRLLAMVRHDDAFFGLRLLPKPLNKRSQSYEKYGITQTYNPKICSIRIFFAILHPLCPYLFI